MLFYLLTYFILAQWCLQQRTTPWSRKTENLQHGGGDYRCVYVVGLCFFLDCHLDCFYLFMLFNAICSLVEASEKQSLCFQTSSTSSRGLQACLTCQSSPTSKQFREENFTSEKQFFYFCLFCIVMLYWNIKVILFLFSLLFLIFILSCYPV